ncbi:hypothetical protein SS50377_26377 [Spironucleus salmonicida]|uniref:Uncharacterized protein n=1 Tax=Spironucleus salmonicida TaxID=348837 RepID=V6LVN4_9EUKA|nr:hypothetical protein SS50377_26377 [Spironucleus salmonicida]|eukprot:EST47756.1 Hypothetical protein SS50377_12155 [Spironucleus salmonicida]
MRKNKSESQSSCIDSFILPALSLNKTLSHQSSIQKNLNTSSFDQTQISTKSKDYQKFNPSELINKLTAQENNFSQRLHISQSFSASNTCLFKDLGESECTQDLDLDQELSPMSVSDESVYSTTNLQDYMLRYVKFNEITYFDELSYKIEQCLFYENDLEVSVQTFFDFLEGVDRKSQFIQLDIGENLSISGMLELQFDSFDLDVESVQVTTLSEEQ